MMVLLERSLLYILPEYARVQIFRQFISFYPQKFTLPRFLLY